MTELNELQTSNDNFKEILKNGEPRSALDEECQRLGIPNIQEYVDAIEAYGEKRLVVLTDAGAHFLIDKKPKETVNIPKSGKRFKRYLKSITGKRGELKMFKPKMKIGEG
jgi:glutaredoxin-related protein